MLGLAARPQPGVVVLTEALVAGSRRWRGARRPAGTAGVWLGGRGGHRGHVWALKAEPGSLGTVGAQCALRAAAAAVGWTDPAVFRLRGEGPHRCSH